MGANGWLQFALYLLVLVLLVKPLGGYMARVFDGTSRIVRACGGLERGLYRLCAVAPATPMDWRQYTLAVLIFNLLGALLVYALQRLQAPLPLNPQHLSAVSADSAFDTAISFITNTNWQGYAGETTMSYLTQMLGLAPYQSVALLNPISVSEPLTDAAGNPIKDAQGNPKMQTVRVDSQTLPLGPAASQIAIKQLGSNGGGFFNVNSAHPFENPTPLSDFLELLAILLIPAALCYTFGQMIGDRRQGWALLAAMLVLFVPLLIAEGWSEGRSNPAYPAIVAQVHAEAPLPAQAGGNMEGKETRFGVADSALWSVATTAAGRQGTALQIGEWRIELAARHCQNADGRALHLTPTEYRLLEVLHRRAGLVVTHRVLLQQAWGPGIAERVAYLRVYMRQLRGKLEPDPTRPRWLLTETGVGYRLVQPESAP